MSQQTFLVFGASGQTGQHFISLALKEGNKVRAVVRNLQKITLVDQNLELYQGSITQALKLDDLLAGVDYVVAMLGDAAAQKDTKICTAFVKELIPAMRRQQVKRFLYQAGGLTKPYKQELPPVLWAIRNTLARGFDGQHKDNEAVIEYLVEQAPDMEWMVHRAGIGSNGPSKGTLQRSKTKFSIATFQDCAAYNFRTIMDDAAIRTCDFSHYVKEV